MSQTKQNKTKLAPVMMEGAEVILKVLEDQGVDVIFGYPGGAVLPIYDAIFRNNKIRHVLVRHEQAAVHAAEGYARSTGKVGVVLVTSGPGATNAVTGLTDALMDSVPIICLSGQVPSHLIGSDAFQEADTSGITRPCTKYNYLVKKSADLQANLEEAFHVARTGRPGPVIIDLPKDIQLLDAPYNEADTVMPKRYQPQTQPDAKLVKKVVSMMKKAKKPVIYAGGGIINSGTDASTSLRELVSQTGWPTTLTLMGLGAVDASDQHFLGMLGMHGTYEANMTMHDCDFMLNVGARFDDRVTGNLMHFSPNSVKVHADIDASSIDKVVKVDVGIVSDANAFLQALLAEMKAQSFASDQKSLKGWIEARFDKMIDAGALGEVARLSARKLDPDLPVMKALGVKPLAAVQAGQLDEAAAIELIKRDTRRYAKRQMTWLRNNFISKIDTDSLYSESLSEKIFSKILDLV